MSDAYDRERRSAVQKAALERRRATGKSAEQLRLSCPECDKIRQTVETLRVHRWLAHDVRTAPPREQ